jgi:hypothetical protein
MFTQKEQKNINKCNGCHRLCDLGAYYNTGKHPGYLPTINSVEQKHYIDNNNTKHDTKLFNNRRNAINCARTIATFCPYFKDTRIQKIDTSQLVDRCIGCSNHCKCSAVTIQGFFFPKIGSKIIRKYINRFGETEEILPTTNEFKTKMRAMLKISKLCDNYQTQK